VRSATIAGTSWAQREALRALAVACARANGAVPLRKLLSAHTGRFGKLLDLGLVQSRAGETREHHRFMGERSEYVETIYEPTAAGHELIERTAGETPPAPAPLRDEHWTILAVLGQPFTGNRRPSSSAASIASRLGGELTAQQVGQRLSLLARHGFADDIARDYMAPTHWIITPAGEDALVEHTAAQTGKPS
jgi:hypothetical protein